MSIDTNKAPVLTSDLSRESHAARFRVLLFSHEKWTLGLQICIRQKFIGGKLAAGWPMTAQLAAGDCTARKLFLQRLNFANDPASISVNPGILLSVRLGAVQSRTGRPSCGYVHSVLDTLMQGILSSPNCINTYSPTRYLARRGFTATN